MFKSFSILILALLISNFVSAASIQKTQKVGAKVDVLFVIDNSGSMKESVLSLIANIPTFIDSLTKMEIDYNIGVTTTDAYLHAYYPNKNFLRELRDGAGTQHSGVFIVTPKTLYPADVLAINVNQGTAGTGDERAFSSFVAALEYSGNSAFRRPDAALSVIVLSDEDDFSHNDVSDDPSNLLKNYYHTENYNDPKMYPVTEFSTFLKNTGGTHSSTFSAISIQDPACLARQNKNNGQKISRRYVELVNATNGFAGSICDVKNSMTQFADFLANQATPPPADDYVIKLDHAPILATIVIKVNGRLIPAGETDGWTYDATTVSVILHGKAVPAKGDIVSVTYDYEQ